MRRAEGGGMVKEKVLVTGGAGFIGSHVVDRLISEGYPVMVVDNLSTGRRGNLNPGAAFFQADVTDPALGELIRREKPNRVIHLAAQVSVSRSAREPVEDARTNLLGFLRVAGAALEAGAERLVYISSAAVYGEPRYLPIDEEHPVAPLSPYGASKYTPELYLPFFKSQGLDYFILRLANVYGPRQIPEAEAGVVAIFTERLRSGKPVTIYGDGEQTRDFVFVGDVAEAAVMALARGGGETVNIGTGSRTTINRLYTQLAEFSGAQGAPAYAPPRSGDIRHSCLAPQKAGRVLGWSPRVSLEEGLKRTVNA